MTSPPWRVLPGHARAVVAVLLACLFVLRSPAVLPAATYTVRTVPNVQLADKNNYISNPDGIISPEDVRAINRDLSELRERTGTEVAVVAIGGVADNDPRHFATELFQHWGIGQKGKDKGLLILLVTEPPNRAVVFEVGYGLEGVLPDIVSFRLQQRHMIPDLKTGNYSEAMRKGVAAVTRHLSSDTPGRDAMETAPQGQKAPLDFETALLLFGLPILLLLLLLYRRNRPTACPRCGHKTFSYIRREILRQPTLNSTGLAAYIYRCSNCGYSDRQNRELPRIRPIPPFRRPPGPPFGGMRGGGGGSWGGGRSGGGGAASRF